MNSINRIAEVYYSIHLYFTKEFDCFHYEFHVPHSFQRQFQTFARRNESVFTLYRDKANNDILLDFVYQIWKQKHGENPKYTDRDEFKQIKYLFTNNKQTFKEEVDLILALQEISPKSVYDLYKTGKIMFYTFYFSLKYLKFKTQYKNIFMVKTLRSISKVNKFFNFDEEFFKERLKPVQERINFQETSQKG